MALAGRGLTAYSSGTRKLLITVQLWNGFGSWKLRAIPGAGALVRRLPVSFASSNSMRP